MNWALWILASSVLLATYDILKKSGVRNNAVLPTLTIATAAGAVFYVAALALFGSLPDVLGATREVLFLSFVKVLIVGTSWILTYCALRTLPVTIATPIRSSAPALVILLAILIYGESPTLFQGVGMAFVLAGIFAMSWAGKREGIDFLHSRAIAFALGGMAMSALSSIWDKYVFQIRAASVETIQFYFQIGLLFYYAAILGFQRLCLRKHDAFAWRPVIPFIGITLAIADWLYFHGLAYPEVPISVGALLRRFSVVLTFVFGAFIFREHNLKRKAIALLLVLAGIVFLVIPAHGAAANVDMPRLGTLRPKTTHEIAAPSWTLGCETLDRDFADFRAYRDYLAPLGIKRIRLQAGWAKCEKVRGVFDFAWLDEIVDFARAQGIEILMDLSYGNPIYPGAGGWDLAAGIPTSGEGLAAWDRWTAAIARHFGSRVGWWAMWNEPDIAKENTPEKIAAFNVRTVKILRQILPHCRVAGLSLAHNTPEWMENCLKPMGDDAKLFDAFIYHGYQLAPEASYPRVEALKVIVARYAPKALLWQCENGAPSEMSGRFALSFTPWSEYTQAKWNLRRMLGDRGHDVMSSVFTICDFNHRGREMNLKGLLRANEDHHVIAVKRAYYAVQHLVSVFDGTETRIHPTSARITDTTIAHYEYRLANGSPLLAFWVFAEEGGRDATQQSAAEENTLLRPSDSFVTRPMVINWKGRALVDPVWVDLMTGAVYAFPAEDQIVHSCGITFVNVPVYDSPCLLTERKALSLAN